MPAATQLKVIMFSLTNQFTKDVRTADGWQITIKLDNQETLIQHNRREVAMNPGKDNFTFDWSLNVFLISDCSKVQKVSLSAQNLICDPNFDPVIRDKVRDSFLEIGK